MGGPALEAANKALGIVGSVKGFLVSWHTLKLKLTSFKATSEHAMTTLSDQFLLIGGCSEGQPFRS